MSLSKIYFAPVPFVRDNVFLEQEANTFFAREFGRRFATVSLIKSSSKHPPTGVIELDEPVMAEVYLTQRPVLEYHGHFILLSRKFSEVVYRIPTKDAPPGLKLFSYNGYSYHILQPGDDENDFSKSSGMNWTQFKLSSPEVTIPFTFTELEADDDTMTNSLKQRQTLGELTRKILDLRILLTNAIFDALEAAHFPLEPFRHATCRPLFNILLKLDQDGKVEPNAKVYFHVSYELLAFLCADAFRKLGTLSNRSVKIEIPQDRTPVLTQTRTLPATLPPKAHSSSPFALTSQLSPPNYPAGKRTPPPRGFSGSLSPPSHPASTSTNSGNYYYSPPQ